MKHLSNNTNFGTYANKRVSGYATLRPNPAYGWTSDTRQTLSEIGGKGVGGEMQL